jgi:hypothetical protein
MVYQRYLFITAVLILAHRWCANSSQNSLPAIRFFLPSGTRLFVASWLNTIMSEVRLWAKAGARGVLNAPLG